MRITGFREFIAPCGTNAISAQPDLAQRGVVQLHQVASGEEHPAADDPARRAGHAHQGGGHRGLAGAGFADETEALARHERERHVVDGRHVAGIRAVDDLEVLDLGGPGSVAGAAGARGGRADDGCHQSRRSRGLAKRSIPAEVTNRARKMNAMTTIGGPHHHQKPRRTAVYCCDQ